MNHPQTTPVAAEHSDGSSAAEKLVRLSEFDRHRRTLVTAAEEDDGWATELRCYLKDMPANVSKETDIIRWWQVFRIPFN